MAFHQVPFMLANIKLHISQELPLPLWNSLCLQLLTVAVTWIAAKIEEQTHIVQLNDVALAFDVLQQRENGVEEIDVTDPKSEKFKELRAEIATKYEMGVFHALGFICHVDHPHKLTANLPGLIFYDSQQRTAHIPDGLLQVLQ